MIVTTSDYTTKKKEYYEKIEEQKKLKVEYEKLIKSRYNLLANVRISLKHFQILARLLSHSQNKGINFQIPEYMPHVVEAPEEDEIDGVKIIPELQSKFSRLAGNAKEILTGSAMENGYKVFEHMMKQRTNMVEADIVMSEESLIEAVFLDSSVLTRDDVKKKSAEIVALNSVDEEQQLAVMPKRRKKFKF